MTVRARNVGSEFLLLGSQDQPSRISKKKNHIARTCRTTDFTPLSITKFRSRCICHTVDRQRKPAHLAYFRTGLTQARIVKRSLPSTDEGQPTFAFRSFFFFSVVEKKKETCDCPATSACFSEPFWDGQGGWDEQRAGSKGDEIKEEGEIIILSSHPSFDTSR